MTETLCLLVCEHFEKEVAAILAAEGYDDVICAAFPARCGRPPLDWNEIAQIAGRSGAYREFIVIGGCCLAKLDRPPDMLPPCRIHRLQQCFHLLLNQEIVDHLVAGGAYLLTPGWVAHWRQKIRDWGFDELTAREFFQESETRFLLLDTGMNPESAAHLRDFADFAGRPYEIIPVGIDFLRLFLSNLILQYQLSVEKQATNHARQQTAEYAMAMDLVNGLARTSTESEVIQNILNMFTMLFAAEHVFYLPLQDGNPGTPQQLCMFAPIDEDAVVKSFVEPSQEYAWTDNHDGFLLRIMRRQKPLDVLSVEDFAFPEPINDVAEQDAFGILGVNRLTFPEYTDRYLNLALNIIGVCGLVIDNARTYQKIRDTDKALHLAKDRAEAGNRAKSEFLANMSHELRTPLNGILGYAQILRRDANLTEKQREAAEIILGSGDHLLTLINDILDLSKIEAGKMELECAPFYLTGMVKTIVEMTRIRAQQKDVAFEYQETCPLPSMVNGDEKRLRQILLNLLGNAVKFTKRGRVTLRVSLRDNRQLRFTVEDTGIGIAPDELNSIFEPFYQAGDRRLFSQGTGLGLSISQRLAQKMGSEIFVTSTPGAGSAFWFDLIAPEIRSAAADAPVESMAQVIGIRGACAILIADDNEFNRGMLKEMLNLPGVRVIEAIDGDDAVQKAVECQPDLILMDLLMPVMDGIEATRRIRRIPALRETPIIAVSANVFEQARQESLAAGCQDFLAKPIKESLLFEKLRANLRCEWFYAHAAESPPVPIEIILPPLPELSHLLKLAKIGDILGVRDYLAHIEGLDARFAAFVAKLRPLVKELKITAIQHLIQSYFEEKQLEDEKR